MSLIWIFCVSFSILGSGATIVEPTTTRSETMLPQSFLPPLTVNTENDFTQNNLPLPSIGSAANSQNTVNCPNSAILMNILNILTNSLPQYHNSMLDPEQLKYVLTVIKNILETTPMNAENVGLYNTFKYIEAQMDKINNPVQKRSLNAIDDLLRAKMSLQYDLPAERLTNCQEILNNLMRVINIAYTQVLRNCSPTENDNINTGNNVANIHNGIYQNPYIYNGINFNPYAPVKRNSTTNFAPPDTSNLKVTTASKDLMNFIKHQEKLGVSNIMSILQNYRPTDASNIPGNEVKNPNGAQIPTLDVNPGSNQIPNVNPVNQLFGNDPNLQQSNIFKPPNGNKIAWQTLLSGLKGVTGNLYENQRYFNYLTQKFHEDNNLGTISTGQHSNLETPYLINGQFVPIQTGVPSLDPEAKNNPSASNQNPPMNPNQQPNLINTNIKISQTEMTNPLIKLPKFENTFLQNLQNLQNLHNTKIQSNLPGNDMYQKLILSQQIPPLANNNQNLFGYNQIIPRFTPSLNTKYYNLQNIITDNIKQGNNIEQLSDINRLLSVANLGKLNTIPNSNGVVELTYLLRRPKPVYEQEYYVKYRLPYETFLNNLQKLIIAKPNLRNQPNLLYQELLVGSNVTDTPKDLEGLHYDDILRLTTTNGKLVTAKILENNDTLVTRTLKIVQRLNAKLPVENLINLNTNATESLRLETQNKLNGNSNSSAGVDYLLQNPYFFDTQRRVHANLKYPLIGQNLYNPNRIQVNPYIYKAKPAGYVGSQLLQYGPTLPYANPNINPLMSTG